MFNQQSLGARFTFNVLPPHEDCCFPWGQAAHASIAVTSWLFKTRLVFLRVSQLTMPLSKPMPSDAGVSPWETLLFSPITPVL